MASRNVRTVPAGLWRALLARDGGCSWERCDMPAGWCQVAHGNLAFSAGGRLSQDNAALLCARHHRRFDTGGWTMHINGTTVTYTNTNHTDPEPDDDPGGGGPGGPTPGGPDPGRPPLPPPPEPPPETFGEPPPERYGDPPAQLDQLDLFGGVDDPDMLDGPDPPGG